jgi:hypothetical protein
MKIGDLINIHVDGKGSGGELLKSCLVLTSYCDSYAKTNRKNNSRWVIAQVLVDGKVRLVRLYWDDEYEVISSFEGLSA